MRACAEMAESAVPAMETPRLPRKKTNKSWPRTRSTGTLYKMAKTGSISTSVKSRNKVLATSLARKMANGSLTDKRKALRVSLFCSRRKHGCSISDAAKRNANQRRPGPKRRDSVYVGSKVKLKSTMTSRMKTTVVVNRQREG